MGMRRTATKLDGLSGEDQERSKERFKEKAAEQEWNDRQVFARNLDNLIQMKKLTLKTTADKIRANYQWIRRIVTRGMVRITEENRPYLKKLARLFEISRIEDLWMPDLIVFKVRKEGPALTNEWLQDDLVPYAQKLIRLLVSGKHDYLMELIDRLHGTLLPEPGATVDDDDAS
jgi:hypothetical protein